MAHETELRRRPDPALGAAPPPARPAGAGILLLRDCWSGIAEVRIPLAALDPRRGVLLIAAGPPGMLPAVEGALRQRLAQARFGAVFPGHLPVVVLPADAWDTGPGAATSLAARLEDAFAGRPHLSLPPGGAWVPGVARLLQSPPAPENPRRAAGRGRRRRRTARLRWLVAGLGLGLLLIGGIAGLPERSRVVLSDAPRPDPALPSGFALGWPAPPGNRASRSAEGERPAVRPSDRDVAPLPGSRPERQAEMGSPVGAGRPDAAPRPREAQAGAGTDRTSVGGPAVRPETDLPDGMAGAETDARATTERREAEVRAATERHEAEVRAATERREAEVRAAAERREAERAARRAAAIDAALRAEAMRRREQEEADALRRGEAEAAWRRQQEAAEAALRARQDSEATLRARQQERCQGILQLLRAGGYPAEADLAYFDRRCMPG